QVAPLSGPPVRQRDALFTGLTLALDEQKPARGHRLKAFEAKVLTRVSEPSTARAAGGTHEVCRARAMLLQHLDVTEGGADAGEGKSFPSLVFVRHQIYPSSTAVVRCVSSAARLFKRS